MKFQRKTRRFPKQTAALSLVEVLVAVGILATLAVLLLGVVHRASETSKRVGCLSNLRSLYLIMNHYATDHENLYPNSRYEGVIWPLAVVEYLPMKPTYTRPGIGKGITYCPATGTGDSPYKRDAKSWRCDYNVNSNVFAYDTEGRTLRYRVTVPPSIVLMWDGPGGVNHPESYYFRHQGCFHVLFGDGHTEGVTSSTQLDGRWKR